MKHIVFLKMEEALDLITNPVKITMCCCGHCCVERAAYCLNEAKFLGVDCGVVGVRLKFIKYCCW